MNSGYGIEFSQAHQDLLYEKASSPESIECIDTRNQTCQAGFSMKNPYNRDPSYFKKYIEAYNNEENSNTNIIESSAGYYSNQEATNNNFSDTTKVPNHQKSDPSKIFIGGIGQSTTEATIHSYFSRFGEIVNCEIILDRRSGRSRRFGFITYKNAECAQAAAAERHHIDNVIVECRHALSKSEARAKPANDSFFNPRKIFVGGVPDIVKESEFEQYFSAFGEVIDASLAYDRTSHRLRGFGFVIFSTTEAADQAVGHHMLKGKKVEAKKAFPRQTVQKGRIADICPAATSHNSLSTGKLPQPSLGFMNTDFTEEQVNKYSNNSSKKDRASGLKYPFVNPFMTSANRSYLLSSLDSEANIIPVVENQCSNPDNTSKHCQFENIYNSPYHMSRQGNQQHQLQQGSSMSNLSENIQTPVQISRMDSTNIGFSRPLTEKQVNGGNGAAGRDLPKLCYLDSSEMRGMAVSQNCGSANENSQLSSNSFNYSYPFTMMLPPGANNFSGYMASPALCEMYPMNDSNFLPSIPKTYAAVGKNAVNVGSPLINSEYLQRVDFSPTGGDDYTASVSNRPNIMSNHNIGDSKDMRLTSQPSILFAAVPTQSYHQYQHPSHIFTLPGTPTSTYTRFDQGLSSPPSANHSKLPGAASQMNYIYPTGSFILNTAPTDRMNILASPYLPHSGFDEESLRFHGSEQKGTDQNVINNQTSLNQTRSFMQQAELFNGSDQKNDSLSRSQSTAFKQQQTFQRMPSLLEYNPRMANTNLSQLVSPQILPADGFDPNIAPLSSKCSVSTVSSYPCPTLHGPNFAFMASPNTSANCSQSEQFITEQKKLPHMQPSSKYYTLNSHLSNQSGQQPLFTTAHPDNILPSSSKNMAGWGLHLPQHLQEGESISDFYDSPEPIVIRNPNDSTSMRQCNFLEREDHASEASLKNNLAVNIHNVEGREVGTNASKDFAVGFGMSEIHGGHSHRSQFLDSSGMLHFSNPQRVDTLITKHVDGETQTHIHESTRDVAIESQEETDSGTLDKAFTSKADQPLESLNAIRLSSFSMEDRVAASDSRDTFSPKSTGSSSADQSHFHTPAEMMYAMMEDYTKDKEPQTLSQENHSELFTSPASKVDAADHPSLIRKAETRHELSTAQPNGTKISEQQTARICEQNISKSSDVWSASTNFAVRYPERQHGRQLIPTSLESASTLDSFISSTKWNTRNVSTASAFHEKSMG